MSHTFKAVLTENDASCLHFLEQSVQKEKMFHITGSVRNGREAAQLILEQKPDVAVLDAILPEMDGLCILTHLLERGEPLPIVFFMSHIYSEAIVRKAVDLGVYYYMAKPYSMESLITHMRWAVYRSDIGQPAAAEDKERGIITFILRDIGIPANLQGYYYLREAILYAIRHEESLSRITKTLYPVIAEQFQTTGARLERDMRHAITSAWKRRDTEVMQKYFGRSVRSWENCISNGELIATLAEFIGAGMGGTEPPGSSERLSS